MQPSGARNLWEDEQPRARPDLRLIEPQARRTVRITGQPTPARRRRSPTQQQIASRPDRVALWAVVLGLFLVFMAAATAHAAVL
jgi:hypothetical protein